MVVGVFQTLILGFDPSLIGIAYDDVGSFLTVMFSVKTWREDATIAREHVWSERLERALGLTNAYDRTAPCDETVVYKNNNCLNYK